MKKYTRQDTTSYKYTLVNANLREMPSMTAPILTVVPKDSKVQVIDAAEDWYEVNFNNQKGYLYAPLLSTSKYTWKDTLLRSYADAASNPVLLIPAHDEVQVLSVDGNWSTAIYNNKKGYIFNDLLSDDGSPPLNYDYEFFYTNMTRFVNDNAIKSPTVNLITTDLTNKFTYIFVKSSNNRWVLLDKWACTIGKPTTPTIQGTFYVSGRKPYFGTDAYRAKYATRIQGAYYYHSVLFNAEGTEIIDDRLGVAISHGCIRLAVANAQWIYDNVLDATTIIIH